MAIWKVRQLDNRQKSEEREWWIDDGTDQLCAGVGQPSHDLAEKVASQLNKVVVERLKDPNNYKVIYNLLSVIHEAAQQLEFNASGLSVPPNSPVSAIKAQAASLKASTHELLRMLLD